MCPESRQQKLFTINPEDLAYWYFRLNGFLTIKNFVVHPDVGSRQRTDVDIIACRFPHRSELNENSMIDDPQLINNCQRILIYFAEVKEGTCNLNGPWTDRHKCNMQRFLRSLGAFPAEENENVAEYLYNKGVFENDDYRVSLLCIGSQLNNDKKPEYPEVIQILWKNVLEFIYDRFRKYKDQKRDHSQWDLLGKKLYDIATRCNNKDEFFRQIEVRNR